MSVYASIYIPRMEAHHTQESINYFMMYYRIGKVSHVDFTPVNKKPGFEEKYTQNIKSAFVHFTDPNLCGDDNFGLKYKNTGNNYFWDEIVSGGSYKMFISDDEYWLCFNNKNPVQRTTMNIHQVVENGRYLENIIKKQTETISSNKIEIENLKKKIDGLTCVVQQLIGGLFNQNEQTGTINFHLDVLDCKDKKSELNNTSEWNDYPTTRQGDECERKIIELEKKMENLCLHNNM